MTYDNVPVREASRLAADGAQLVDVREPDEFATGSLPGAVNIPLSQLPARYSELNPNRRVVLLCRSGGRSATAAEFLANQRFREVTNLAGGILAL